MERITDFSDYKFRCHALGNITTGMKVGLTEKQQETFDIYHLRKNGEGKPLTENQLITYTDLLKKKKEKPSISKGVKTYLGQLHKQEIFNRRKEISSKYLDKGIMVEPQSISLYSEVVGMPFFKNKERKTNNFITGECDNAYKKIRDIKSSWDLDTFPMHEDNIPNNDYWVQLQGYMDLWDMDEAELIYCLVDTPEMLIEDAKYKAKYQLGKMDLPEELEEEIERQMTFSDIPKELRVKIFPVKRDREYIKALYAQIELCRAHMNELSNKINDKLTLTLTT